MSHTVSNVEDAALEWFADLGYTIGNGPHLAPGVPSAEHNPFCALILSTRLRQSIHRQKPALSAGRTVSTLKSFA